MVNATPAPKKVSDCVGFGRKSKAGNGIKIVLDVKAISQMDTFKSKDGVKRAQVVVNLQRLQEVIEGKREVVAINYIHEE